MNIAIVSYHKMGGSGIVAYEIGAAMAAQGHSIHFVGLEPPFRMNTMEANVMFHSVEVKDYPVFTYPPYTLSLASQLYEIIEHYDIDLIQCHYAVPHAVAGMLARNMASRPVKLMTVLHGTDITLVGSHPSFYNITRWAIQESDSVTAVSDFLVQRTEETFDVPVGSIQRIHNFIDEDYYDPSHECGCLKGKSEGKLVFVHASNLREVKQPLDLIRIFKKVHDTCGDDVCLWILGEGPLQGVMEQEAEKLGIADHIEFFGIASNPALFFACADIFLLTSKEESFGLAALEAMACRTAVVAYGTGGLPEVVEHNVSGMLCNAGSIDDMAEACIMLTENEERLQLFKEAAQKRAIQQFGKQKIIKEYIDLCQKISH